MLFQRPVSVWWEEWSSSQNASSRSVLLRCRAPVHTTAAADCSIMQQPACRLPLRAKKALHSLHIWPDLVEKVCIFFPKGDCHKITSFLVRNLFVPSYRVGCGCNTALQHLICCHVCPSGLSHCYPFVYNQNILTRKIY